MSLPHSQSHKYVRPRSEVSTGFRTLWERPACEAQGPLYRFPRCSKSCKHPMVLSLRRLDYDSNQCQNEKTAVVSST